MISKVTQKSKSQYIDDLIEQYINLRNNEEEEMNHELKLKFDKLVVKIFI